MGKGAGVDRGECWTDEYAGRVASMSEPAKPYTAEEIETFRKLGAAFPGVGDQAEWRARAVATVDALRAEVDRLKTHAAVAAVHELEHHKLIAGITASAEKAVAEERAACAETARGCLPRPFSHVRDEALDAAADAILARGKP